MAASSQTERRMQSVSRRSCISGEPVLGSAGRGTHPDPIRQAVSFENRLGWEISWHSNRHALRIAIERKVRSKIR